MPAKPDLRTISAADLKNLQIDERRQLYWNGERVRSQITLSWAQRVIAAIGVVAGVATIANGFASGGNNAATLACSRGWGFPIIGCPIQPMSAPVASTSPNPAPPTTSPGAQRTTITGGGSRSAPPAP